VTQVVATAVVAILVTAAADAIQAVVSTRVTVAVVAAAILVVADAVLVVVDEVDFCPVCTNDVDS